MPVWIILLLGSKHTFNSRIIFSTKVLKFTFLTFFHCSTFATFLLWNLPKELILENLWHPWDNVLGLGWGGMAYFCLAVALTCWVSINLNISWCVDVHLS